MRLFTLVRWALVAARGRAWVARRQHRSGAFLAYSALAGLGEVAVALTCVGVVLAVLSTGSVAATIIAALIAEVLVLPWPLAHWFAIPRGDHRLAYWLVMVDELGAAGARQPARLAAARAAARAGSTPDALAWLAARKPAHLDGHEVAVQAILAHGRGDRDDARALFLSLAGFADPAPEARELAAEWLALDDAGRGDWASLVARGAERVGPTRGAHRKPAAIRAATTGAVPAGEPLWPATSLTYLLEGVGARLLGHAGAPRDADLWVSWLEAPARAATWPLVRRATATPSPRRRSPPTEATTTATTSPAGAAAGGDITPIHPRAALARALDAHARALTDGSLDAVAAAAMAWDAALTARGLAVEVARRAIDLGAPAGAGDSALASLDDQVTGELARVIDDRGLPLAELAARAPGSALLGAIAARARRELLARLELTCDRIGDRTHDARALEPVDELRTFVAVRRAYELAAAQGGPELERLAYPHVHTELVQWTVWLWNERQEYLLSHLITTWLYERALVVGDAEAIELHGANGAIDIPGL